MPSLSPENYRTRLKTAHRIENHTDSVEMYPCTFCSKNDKKCLVLSSGGSKKCSECVRRGGKCDVGEFLESSWDSYDRQQAKLDAEEEQAIEADRAAIRASEAARAKLDRLRKQKRFLQKRKTEMLRRDLRTLDELDAAEEAERLENERAEKEKENAREMVERDAELERLLAMPNSAGPSLDPAFLEAYPADHALWADLGFGGGSPEVPPGTG